MVRSFFMVKSTQKKPLGNVIVPEHCVAEVKVPSNTISLPLLSPDGNEKVNLLSWMVIGSSFINNTHSSGSGNTDIVKEVILSPRTVNLRYLLVMGDLLASSLCHFTETTVVVEVVVEGVEVGVLVVVEVVDVVEVGVLVAVEVLVVVDCVVVEEVDVVGEGVVEEGEVTMLVGVLGTEVLVEVLDSTVVVFTGVPPPQELAIDNNKHIIIKHAIVSLIFINGTPL
jgi:hypothetical protein